ncbi:MAG: 4Fe-4S binding protein, partial [Planctomycetota bacterium]|nr:4Fe-4S binding protein [Planctomycetota bacterium]
YVDCDVEGANGHIFFKPEITMHRPVAIDVPEPTDACTGCGACAKVCRFGALAALKSGVLVFNELCHSCGACLEACPSHALRWTKHVLGHVRLGRCRAGRGQWLPFTDGELAVGQVRASAVIRQVKAAAPEAAHTVLDCPPGASCAVTEAVRGADLCLLVTEPTPLGLSDLDKALTLARHLGVPCGVVLNRGGLTRVDVGAFCRAHEVPLVATFPYDQGVARLYAEGRLVVEELAGWRRQFETLAAATLAMTSSCATRQGEATVAARTLDEAGEPLADGPPRPPEDAFQVVILSGKGGTGKTCLASSLAVMAGGVVAADADVDAANLHLVLKVSGERQVPFSGGHVAAIDPAKCRGCGICANECRFEAIALREQAVVDPLKCEGCGLCALVCPLAGTDEQPIRLLPRLSGYAYVGNLPNGALARGELLPGGEASGKLVTLVRRMADARAADFGHSRMIIDASPGMGCPVNASLTGCDWAIAVTEPTQSGLHDLRRALDLAAWFKVPAAVVINKADLCPEVAAEIRVACGERGIEVLGEIPFDRHVPEDLALGRAPVLGNGCAATALRDVCRAIWDRMATSGRLENRSVSLGKESES